MVQVRISQFFIQRIQALDAEGEIPDEAIPQASAGQQPAQQVDEPPADPKEEASCTWQP